MHEQIYLDAAATTKPNKKVLDVMMPYFYEKWHNPSSLYGDSNSIKRDIERARDVIGYFIGAKRNEIFFTSGGSESNCWAIQGFVNECLLNNERPLIITSTIEHKSIMECVLNANANSFYVEVDSEGFIDMGRLEQLLSCVENANHKTLVSIQFANNEIGTIQHIKEIAELAHRYNALFHTDAVQAFGQIDINVNDLDIDMLSASGHKIGAPKGIGFLYKKNGVEIQPLIYGSQMDGMRGGTENVPYIIGMAKAIELIQEDEEYELRTVILRNNFIAQLKALGCRINGSLDYRLPNNINVTFPHNISGESLIYMLDMSGIYVSAGSACNSRSIEPSYTLKAIGMSNEDADKTIRITIPSDITMNEIDRTVCEIEKSIKLIEL